MSILSIREYIVELRKNQKVRQNKVASHLGVSRYTLNRFEKGKVELKLDKLQLYADYLGYEIRLLKK